MIIQKIRDDWEESKETRDLTIEQNSKSIQAETEQYRINIVDRTQKIINEINKSYDSEIDKKFEEGLLIAYQEIIDKYQEIISISSSDDINTDLENKNINRKLNRQIKYFPRFVNSHKQRISLYGDIPEEFLDICNKLQWDLEKLI